MRILCCLHTRAHYKWMFHKPEANYFRIPWRNIWCSCTDVAMSTFLSHMFQIVQNMVRKCPKMLWFCRLIPKSTCMLRAQIVFKSFSNRFQIVRDGRRSDRFKTIWPTLPSDHTIKTRPYAPILNGLDMSIYTGRPGRCVWCYNLVGTLSDRERFERFFGENTIFA